MRTVFALACRSLRDALTTTAVGCSLILLLNCIMGRGGGGGGGGAEVEIVYICDKLDVVAIVDVDVPPIFIIELELLLLFLVVKEVILFFLGEAVTLGLSILRLKGETFVCVIIALAFKGVLPTTVNLPALLTSSSSSFITSKLGATFLS